MEKNIRALLRQTPSKPMKPGDIAGKLGLRGSEALKTLRETLAQMTLDGTLIKKGKLFINESKNNYINQKT